MIEARGLTKRYGEKTAVDDLTFTVRPGVVTGFLGPNGAGKSTTMRMILGLDAPDRRDRRPSTAGRTPSTPAPLHEVGALLEARAVHTGRSAPQPPAGAGGDAPASAGRRVDEVIEHGRAAARWPASGPAASRSAWASGSASPPRCSATRRR